MGRSGPPTASPAIRRTAGGAALSRWLYDLADGDPDRPAVLAADGVLSCAELASRASRLARLLIDRGCGPGIGVAVRLEYGAEPVPVVWAVLLAGAAVVPVPPGAPAGPYARVGITMAVAPAWLALDDPVVRAELAVRSARPVTHAVRRGILRGTDPAVVAAGACWSFDDLAVRAGRLGAAAPDCELRWAERDIAGRASAVAAIAAAANSGSTLVVI